MKSWIAPSCRRTGRAATALALVLGLAACGGSRLSSDEIRAANLSYPSNDGLLGTVAPADPLAPVAGGESAQAPAPAAAPGAPSSAVTGSVNAGGANGAAAPARPSSGPPTGSSTSKVPTTGTGTSTRAAVPIVGSSGCARQLEPIRIGQNGSFSGLVGNSIGGLRTGAALWAKAVNAAGGIACHPIQLFQTDDQSNPTKAATNVKDLIQNKKVVAFIGLGSPIVIASVRAELDKAGIPAIGGTQVELDWEQDALLYNVGGWGFPSMAVVVKQAAINSGGKKFGLMHCVEATLCTTFKDKFSGAKGYAARLGLDFAFSQSFSLTQSSFTSACQNAKAAGVDVLFPVSDASAFQRLVRDCAAINYKPAYVSGSIALSAPVAVDPNVRSHGVLVGAPVAPFVSSGGAGLAAFNAAAKQYLGQQPLDQNILMGWASGQLLAKALAQVDAEARGGVVTTALILKGLSKVKGETLDGLTPPMTLASNSAPLECGYVLAIGTTGYEAPIGRKVVCL